MVFVPTIFWSAIVMVSFAAVPTVMADALSKVPVDIGVPLNWAFVATVVYALYYLSLSVSFGTLGVVLVVALMYACNAFVVAFGASAFNYALGAHIVAWAAQFYAHDKFERTSVWLCGLGHAQWLCVLEGGATKSLVWCTIWRG